MTALLFTFAAAASLLWVSVFGYVLILHSLVRSRNRPARNRTYPDIAVVVPTLNEEPYIRAKLHDLRRTVYPSEHLTLIVVDGGSTDRTAELVQHEIDGGAALQLLCVDGTRGKAAQLNHALAQLDQEIVVITDVDAILEPTCIQELVDVLTGDPQTAVVGATVWPASGLAEERLHWSFLNYLWWLEGEVLSCGTVAAPCYALRRARMKPLAADVRADDVHLALAAGASGLTVRTCRTANAVEIRVPQTVREFLHFRRRRASAYVTELLRSTPPGGAARGYRLMRRLRLWHLRSAPRLSCALLLAGAVLVCTPHWPWVVITLIAFLAPGVATARISIKPGAFGSWWRLGWTAARLCGITCLSLLFLSRWSPAFAGGGR